MSSKQTKRSFAPTPGKLAYGHILGKSRHPTHVYKDVPMYITIENDPRWVAWIEADDKPKYGTFEEVIAAIDGKSLPIGPQAPQHLRTVPKE